MKDIFLSISANHFPLSRKTSSSYQYFACSTFCLVNNSAVIDRACVSASWIKNCCGRSCIRKKLQNNSIMIERIRCWLGPVNWMRPTLQVRWRHTSRLQVGICNSIEQHSIVFVISNTTIFHSIDSSPGSSCQKWAKWLQIIQKRMKRLFIHYDRALSATCSYQLLLACATGYRLV
jgi:hypothetical protein